VESTVRLVAAIPLGLAFGSFLTVAISRLPSGKSLVRPRSACPSCGRRLRAIDNVPLLSWLLLRGRCRSCGTRISPVYPLTELATAGLFAAAALTVEDPWVAVLFAPFLGLLVAVTVIDVRHKIIPNRLVYPAVLVSAAYLVVARIAGGRIDLPDALIGFLAYGGGLLLVALISPRGMGMGDVKLAALVGLVLGALGIRFVGVAAGVGILVGGVGALLALLFGATRKTGLPYGPAIAVGAAVAVFAGDRIADAYLRVLAS
jgi:leader peptidase (prepilin peptidase)/N-methyltransferase